MKHTTPDEMKFKKLVRRLNVSRVVAVGTLELLWIATQKNAPQGDIGKYTDEEIAIECDWQGEPELLVRALVESGWIDHCPDHRLVIHDWEDHAPGWIKRQLARHKRSFVTVSSRPTVTGDGLELTPKERKPKETKGNLKKQGGASSRLSRPSIEEIQEFARASSLPDHAPAFHDYYQSNGWKVGKNPMKDWQATYRNWCRRDQANGKKTTEVPI